MPSKSKPPNFTAAERAELESPELTDEELSSLRPASEALSPALVAALTGRKPGQRGAQKAPTKEMITLRVDRDVVAAFRATGPRLAGPHERGAQSRIAKGAVTRLANPAKFR